MVRSHPPLVTWPLRRFSLICRRSCSRMSLKIFAPLLTFATKHGRYLRKMDKRGIGTLSFVRASRETVMVVIGQAQGSRFEPRRL